MDESSMSSSQKCATVSSIPTTPSTTITTVTSSSMSTLQNLLESVIRVRNRLVHMQDDNDKGQRFYHVLTGLLPRLLQKLDENSLALVAVVDTHVQKEKEEQQHNCRVLRQELQSQLIGIISHAMERIRGITCTEPIVAASPASPTAGSTTSTSSATPSNVVSSLLPLLETLKSNVGRTMLLLLLQTCMNAHCREGGRRHRHRPAGQQQQQQSPCHYLCTQTIPTLIRSVNRIHEEILWLQQQQQTSSSSSPDDGNNQITLELQQQQHQQQQLQPPDEFHNDGQHHDGSSIFISETLKSHFRITGWLLLDAIAVQSGLVGGASLASLLEDTDADFDSGISSTTTNDWDHLGLEPATQAAIHQAANDVGDNDNSSYSATTATTNNSSGTLDLFLDILLFWPLDNTRQRRLPDGGDFDNSTGISLQGMKRMNYHHQSGSSTGVLMQGAAELPPPAEAHLQARVERRAAILGRQGPRRATLPTSLSWNELHLRQLKYVTLKCAIWPAGKGLFQTTTKKTTTSNSDGDDGNDNTHKQIVPTGDTSAGGTLSDRALLLGVLFSSPNSMHGRLAMSVINPHLAGSAGRFLRRVGNEWHCQKKQDEHEQVESKCSSGLACSILILMLGDAAAQPVLAKYNNNDPENSWKSILGPRPTLSQFQRSPLPVHIASRGMDFIRNHFRPNIHRNHVEDGIRLFMDLVVAIQDPRCHGAYWGIQLIQPLYIQNQKLLQQRQASNVADMSDRKHDEDDSWMIQFHKQCLLTARAVLSTVPEATVLQVDPRQERRPQEQQQIHDGGAHPFGPRGDLNRLLADHRVSRKKRRLRSEGAVQARQTAYSMITDLCSSMSSGSGSCFPLQLGANSKEGEKGNACHFDLPALIFQCAASEEESLQPLVARALEALLLEYKKMVDDDKNNHTLQQNLAFVAPLLPSLICAASADSTVARVAVIRWCSEFLAHHDPDAALHICHYLTDDHDTCIANMAKKAIPTLKMLGTSPSSSSVVMAPPVKLLDMKHPSDVMEIQQDLQQRVQHLAANRFPNLSDCIHRSECSQLLLQDFRYSVQNVEEALELDYEGTLVRAGISRNNDIGSDVFGSKDQEFMCGICYDEALPTGGFALPCGHRYCFHCWRSYLVNIMEDGAASSSGVAKAKCPENNCGERLMTKHVHEIHSELLSQWEDALLTHFLELDKCYRPCPGPDCTMVAHVSPPVSQPVDCTKCHTSFCFLCGREPHKPAKCGDFAVWNQIFGSSEFWVKKNAKPCPSCAVPIEKNDGCNHMRCSRCSTDFCWLCLSPLYRHLEAHTCNRFDPTTIADNDEQRRALFYTDRYQAHDDAEMFVKDRMKTLDHSLAKLTERFWFVDVDEKEILSTAIETLARARRCLKYSYITAWAKRQDRDSQQAFESHQATLELVTERLSNMTIVNWDELYHTEGERGVRRFFGAISFHTSSIARYMIRLQLLEDE